MTKDDKEPEALEDDLPSEELPESDLDDVSGGRRPNSLNPQPLPP